MGSCVAYEGEVVPFFFFIIPKGSDYNFDRSFLSISPDKPKCSLGFPWVVTKHI